MIPEAMQHIAGRIPVTDGSSLPTPVVAGPLSVAPPRRPGSVRRTSSLDVTWPDGQGTAMRMLGRCRDLATFADGRYNELAYDAVKLDVDADRTIRSIEATPHREGVDKLVGARGGGGMRLALDQALPTDRSGHTPLALLLDDVAGASLVGGFAWSRHSGDWMRGSARSDGAPLRRAARTMVGICSGFRPGASSLSPDGTNIGDGHAVMQVPPLADPEDPVGWHRMDPLPSVGLRRARRMDLWRDGDRYLVDAHFRDACSDPQLYQVAVHEYSLSVAIDAGSLKVTSLEAIPRVLPYAECPAASNNVGRMEGQRLADLQSSVLAILRGVDCCTHLNDCLRALADIAALIPAADAAGQSRYRPDGPHR